MTMCLAFALIYIILGKLFNNVYSSSIATFENPHTNYRTAIIISGQLRSGNYSFTSGKLQYDQKIRWFGNDDGKTPIETVIFNVINRVALYGGVDLFIYIQVNFFCTLK